MSVQAMTYVWENFSKGGSSLLVMLAVANYAHKDGTNAFPSLETLAKDCRMSRRQIIRIIKQLEESGDLVINHGNEKRSNYYTIPMPASDKMSLGGSDKMSLGGSDKMSLASDIAMSPEPLTNSKSLLLHSSEEDKSVPSSSKALKAVDNQMIRIADAWKTAFNKNGNVKLTPDRKKKILARLREGYSVEEIEQAIVGCSKSDFHMGQNEKGIKYNDLALICRDGEHLDRFIALAEATPLNGKPKTKAIDDGLIDKEPPPDFMFFVDPQEKLDQTEIPDDGGIYHWRDRAFYENWRDGWLSGYEDRSAEHFALAQKQIREYEESEAFKRRFNGEM